MRVLHVYSGNLFGGIESMLLACASVPAPQSHVEHAFALCFDERLASELRAAGRPVHLLGPVRMSRPASAHTARQALEAILVRERYDRVICHAPWSQAIFGGVALRVGTPLVFWAHDRMTGRHWTERIARHVRPQLVISNSRFTDGTKPALYPGIRSVVVYPPVPGVRPGRERRYVRMSLDTSEHAVVIIQASRCEAWKGHRVLLEALAGIRDLPGWMWWLAGGPQRPEEAAFMASLRQRAEQSGIADRVRWLGQRADVPSLLGAADIHCQANIEPEPFGIAFVEALSAGLPVVAADHGGVSEILDPSCGVLVPRCDPSALAVALRSLITSAPRRRALAAAAPARALALSDPLMQIRRLAGALESTPPMEMAG
jgi:glycosyltransferase involved in cell wall biosynthesis